MLWLSIYRMDIEISDNSIVISFVITIPETGQTFQIIITVPLQYILNVCEA